MKFILDGFSLPGKEIYTAFVEGNGQFRRGYPDSRWKFEPSPHFSMVVFAQDPSVKTRIVQGTKATLLIRNNGGEWKEMDFSQSCSVILPPLLEETLYSEIDLRIGDGQLMHDIIAFSFGHGGEELQYFLETFRANLLKSLSRIKAKTL